MASRSSLHLDLENPGTRAIDACRDEDPDAQCQPRRDRDLSPRTPLRPRAGPARTRRHADDRVTGPAVPSLRAMGSRALPRRGMPELARRAAAVARERSARHLAA